MATTIAPMKNSERPIAWEVSSMEPTRISERTPTSAPEIARASTERRVLQSPRPSVCDSSSCGLKRAAWVRSEKSRPAA
jgi:hypothetical protein